MDIQLIKTESVIKGLVGYTGNLFSVPEILETLVTNPLVDGTNLWGEKIDSRTILIPGGKYNDEMDLVKIVHQPIITDATNINNIDEIKSLYKNSEGIELVIIPYNRITDSGYDSYAVPIEHFLKLTKFKNCYSSDYYSVDDIISNFGFKIQTHLTPEEVKDCNGWALINLKKTTITPKEFEESKQFIREKFVPKAIENGYSLNDKCVMIALLSDTPDKIRHFRISGDFVNATNHSYLYQEGNFLMKTGYLHDLPR